VTVRVNAYVMAADPVFLAASVHSYYDGVGRIVVSYDENRLSWSGEPIPVGDCLAELSQIDRDSKLDFSPGRYSHPELPPLDCETRQRQAALDSASKDAEWVLQLDSDEVIPDFGAFSEMVLRADRSGADALEFPSRWLYARTGERRYLEVSSRWWRAAAGYPGPLAVRAGTRLRLARQCEGSIFRVDFRRQSTDPWHPRDAPVHATVPVDDGVLHFSWVRSGEQMERKAATSGHRDDFNWQARLRRWRFHQRHPLIAVALTPLRRKRHPTWLRRASVPIDPAARVLI
jgi:hypothetical protein